MTFGDKLSKLRRENNVTQEQLADYLGVSRQSISKWESDIAYPETDKIIKMSELFNCSLDYLLRDGETQEKGTTDNSIEQLKEKKAVKEYKSKRTLWGLPLWHVAKNAKGIIAIGVKAQGLIAIGVQARGIISVGVLALGLISCGTLSLGLLFSVGLFSAALFSVGTVSAGIYAVGAISIGVFSLGAVAVGDVAVGALAVGKYVAIGGYARGAIAIGGSKAVGSTFTHVGKLTDELRVQVADLITQTVPSIIGWAGKIAKALIS
ncbi:MAG: helix-turn-helix domain-containing protein [Clostridia bacterium]|nr:helix-turn-helix domain-containing protein [Clostridia bacterium]